MQQRYGAKLNTVVARRIILVVLRSKQRDPKSPFALAFRTQPLPELVVRINWP